jgi:hypothetical protein
MPRVVLSKPPSAAHYYSAKVMGATMWCWILWRFKHDWKDVFVRRCLCIQAFLHNDN